MSEQATIPESQESPGRAVVAVDMGCRFLLFASLGVLLTLASLRELISMLLHWDVALVGEAVTDLVGGLGFLMKAYVVIPVPARVGRWIEKKAQIANGVETLDGLDAVNAAGSLLVLAVFFSLLMFSPYNSWPEQLIVGAIPLYIALPRARKLWRYLQSRQAPVS